jgi:hypothetical protein
MLLDLIVLSRVTITFFSIKKSWLLMSAIPSSLEFLRGWKLSKIQLVMPYWRKVIQDFGENRQLAPFKNHSDHSQVRIQKRWEFIQKECNKFWVAIENLLGYPGLGVVGTVIPRPFKIDTC